MPEYYDDTQYLQQQLGGYPQLQPPIKGANLVNNDQSFLQWLFSFRKEAIIPLRNAWRGLEFDFNTQEWIYPQEHAPHVIMNEKGITWAISLIESYMNPVFITTDFDSRTYNFTMREASKVIWNSLSLRYKEFELQKSDIPRVAEEIESKIRAILSGARNDGYRRFFSTQHQSSEIKNLSEMKDGNKGGLFSGMKSLFRGQGGQQ